MHTERQGVCCTSWMGVHAVGLSTDSCRAADAAEDAGAAEEGLAGATSSRSASLYSAHRRVMGVQGERATSGLSMEGSGVSEPSLGLTPACQGENALSSHMPSQNHLHTCAPSTKSSVACMNKRPGGSSLADCILSSSFPTHQEPPP